MAEIITLCNGEVAICGGSEAFKVLQGVRNGRIKLPKAPTQKTKGSKRPKVAPVVVLTQPRLEPKPKPKQVAKPKPEAVEELKAGDWLKGLQSLTTKGKEGEVTKQ